MNRSKFILPIKAEIEHVYKKEIEKLFVKTILKFSKNILNIEIIQFKIKTVREKLKFKNLKMNHIFFISLTVFEHEHNISI